MFRKDKADMKGYKRHKFLFGFLRGLLSWIFRWKFNLQLERFGGDGEPYMVLANHTSNYDPIMLAMATRDHMYFVASEHLSRKGLISKLLTWAFAPISRLKGGTDAQAAMTVLRTVRKGANVCMFPEGSRTFSGVTYPIYPATGKLVRSSGVKLITYKIKGGYFSDPRWARKLRRGRMTGEVVGVYTAEQLRDMDPDDVNALLARDLYEDAYETQQRDPVAFKGKDLAEYLQAGLFLCPGCGGIDTLHTSGDGFWCDCGLKGRYTEYGYLEGEGLRFTTVRDWDDWQQQQIPQLVADLGKTPIGDDGITLLQVTERGKDKPLAHGRLTLYDDRLVCGDKTIRIDDISDLAIIGRDKLVFSDRDAYYELRPDKVYCATKYVALFIQLKKTR